MSWKKGKITEKRDGKYIFSYIKNGKEKWFGFQNVKDDIRIILDKCKEDGTEIKAKWDKESFTIEIEQKQYHNLYNNKNKNKTQNRKNIYKDNSNKTTTNQQNNSLYKKLPDGERYLPINNVIADFENNHRLKDINSNLLYNKFIWKWSKNNKNNIEIPNPNKKNNEINFQEKIERIGIQISAVDIYSKKMINIHNILNNKFEIKNFSLSLSGRLNIGLGSSNPSETGFLLHHIYGVPYIPGSALKGIARGAAIVEIAEKIKDKMNFDDENIFKCFSFVDTLIEAEYSSKTLKEHFKSKNTDILKEDINKITQKIITKEKDKKTLKYSFLNDLDISDLTDKILSIREIFGTKSTSGKVFFLESYPDKNVRFKADIMNPHYPDYYDKAKKIPPADWQSPNPINFLTVEGGKFYFTIYKNKKLKNLLTETEKYLKKALTEFGVGSKTALGYGLFVE